MPILTLNFACCHVKGWYDDQKNVPPKDRTLVTHPELLAVYDVPPVTDESNEAQVNARDYGLKVLTWYHNELLPSILPSDYYGPTVRPHWLGTDRKPLSKGQVEKSKHRCIPLKIEAWALTMTQNCTEGDNNKWLNIYNWKVDHPNEKVPK